MTSDSIGVSLGKSEAGQNAQSTQIFPLRRSLVESWWLVVLLAVSGAWSCYYIYSTHLNWPPIRSDGYGYYAYVPSVFIDHDLSLKSARSHIPNASLGAYGIAFIYSTGKFLDKYPIGAAVLQTPFFLIAHALAAPLRFAPDGYSLPYQIANMAAAIFYMCLGAFFLYSACRTFFGRAVSSVTCLALVFGTNVFHYATYDASFSHIYQFGLTSVCLWLGVAYGLHRDGRSGLLIAVAFGLVVGLVSLTRLTNIIMILIPFIVIVGRQRDGGEVKAMAIHLAIVGALVGAVVSLQMLYLRYTCGMWVLNSYAATHESATFNWLHPELVNFLFSMRKGIFFWSPILAFATIGFVLAIRQYKWITIASVATIAVHVYICASWYCWWFGGGYGSRPAVDITPLFAVPLAMLLEVMVRKRAAIPTGFVVTAAALANLVFTYGYWRGYIPLDEVQTKDFTELPAKLFK